MARSTSPCFIDDYASAAHCQFSKGGGFFDNLLYCSEGNLLQLLQVYNLMVIARTRIFVSY